MRYIIYHWHSKCKSARLSDSYTGFDKAGGDIADDEIDAVSGAFDAMGDPATRVSHDKRVGN